MFYIGPAAESRDDARVKIQRNARNSSGGNSIVNLTVHCDVRDGPLPEIHRR